MTKKLPQTTGDIWVPSKENPATVPISTKLVMTHISGPFRERERKLWTFLVHAVWDELESKQIHELPMKDISRVFRQLGGDHNNSWLREYLTSIAETTIRFEAEDSTKKIWMVSSLLSAAVIVEGKGKLQGTDVLQFSFPPQLVQALKERERFTRLRPHLMITLSGKYAVSLYELLESVANMDRPYLKASVSDLRNWLAVPEGKLSRWADLQRFAIRPALRELNEHSEDTGFSVQFSVQRGRRNKVEGVVFEVKKLPSRKSFEARLRKNKTQERNQLPILTTKTYGNAQKIAQGSGLDIYALEADWRSEFNQKAALVKNPQGHFVSYVKRRVQNPKQENQGFFASLFGKRSANQ